MSVHPLRRPIVVALAAVAPAVAAPAARAELVTFGSTLSAPATLAEARPTDTLYWQARFATGGSPLVPADGQLRAVRLKGIALSNPVAGVPGGETTWHVQVLRGQADGTFKILRTSQAFYVPTTGDAQQVTTYAPENLCVARGDVVAFNSVGGASGPAGGPYPSGTPLQIFARVAGALVAQFTGRDQTNNGDVVGADSTRGADHELLMQMTVGTGADGTGLCPGGGTPTPAQPGPGTTPPPPGAPAARKVTIPRQRVTVSRTGRLRIALYCQPGSSPCAGTVRVLAASTGRRLATRRYTIGSRKTGKVSLRLNAAGRRMLAAGRGRLPAKIVTVTAPGGADRTVTRAITLRRRG